MPTPIDRESSNSFAATKLRNSSRFCRRTVSTMSTSGCAQPPLKTLDAESAASLDPSRPVIVYCYDYR